MCYMTLQFNYSLFNVTFNTFSLTVILALDIWIHEIDETAVH